MLKKKQSGTHDVLVVLGPKKSKVAKEMAKLAPDHFHYPEHNHPLNYEELEKGVNALDFISYGIKKVGEKKKHVISATPTTACEMKNGRVPILIEDPKNFEELHDKLVELGLNPLYCGIKTTPNQLATMLNQPPQAFVEKYKKACDVYEKNNIITFPLMNGSSKMIENTAKHFIAHYTKITGKKITVNSKPAKTAPVAETEMVEA